MSGGHQLLTLDQFSDQGPSAHQTTCCLPTDLHRKQHTPVNHRGTGETTDHLQGHTHTYTHRQLQLLTKINQNKCVCVWGGALPLAG